MDTHRPDVSNKEEERVPRLERGKTKVRVGKLARFLNSYPNREAARLLLSGFSEGFWIPCTLSVIPPVSDNLQSAKLHSTVVSEKLLKDVSLGRMSAPFRLFHWGIWWCLR